MAYGAKSISRLSERLVCVTDASGDQIRAVVPVDANGDPVDMSSLTVTVAGSGTPAAALVDTGEELGAVGTSRTLLVTNSGSSSTRVGAVNLTDLDVVIRETAGSVVISPRIPPRGLWEDDIDIGSANIDVATVTGTTTTGRVTGYIKH